MKLRPNPAPASAPKREPREVPWMEFDLYSDVWSFQRPDLQVLRFSFHEELGNGFRLSDLSHVHLREAMVEAIAAYAAHQGFGLRDGQTVYYLARRFLRLFRWLEVMGIPLTAVNAVVGVQYAKHLVAVATKQGTPAGMPTFSEEEVEALWLDESSDEDVSQGDEEDEDVGIDADAAPSNQEVKSMRANTLHGLLAPLQLLWKFRNRFSLQLPEEPFPDGTAAIAEMLGLEDGHGEVIPLDSGCHLLFGCLNLLLVLGPQVIAASQTKNTDRYSDDHFDELNATSARLGLNLIIVGQKRTNRGHEENVYEFQSVISMILPHALLVVLGCLVFARSGEVKELKTDSISGGTLGGYWLTRRIGKNYRQDRGTPISPEGVQAVRIIEELFRSRREQLLTNALLPKRPTEKNCARLINFTSAELNRLARITRVPAEAADGTSAFWHFTPRQFRMFGACLWVYQFELPVTALSVAMFHFDWTMTSYYLRHPTIRGWVDTVKRRFTLEFVEKAASGGKGFAGLESKRLVRLQGRLRVTMQLSTEDAVKRVVRAVALDQNLVVRPNAWGYCFAPLGIKQERRAQCMKEGVGRVDEDGHIDSKASCAGICCGCRFFGSSASRLPYLRVELKRVDARATSPRLDESAKNLEKQRAALIRGLISDLEAGDAPGSEA